MKAHQSTPAGTEVNSSQASEIGHRDWSTKLKPKKTQGKCAACEGSGEVRTPGQYAVRCPVCLGSRLAHQPENRQLEIFDVGTLSRGTGEDQKRNPIGNKHPRAKKPSKALRIGLEQSVTETHGCACSWLRSSQINEVVRGKIVWQGVVEVYTLFGHATANQAFAWNWKDEAGKSHHTSFLKIPPILSPIDAVQAVVAIEKTEMMDFSRGDRSLNNSSSTNLASAFFPPVLQK